MSLELGDVVQVMSKDARDSGADGWWVGVRQPRSRSEECDDSAADSQVAGPPAQMGIFPCNYVIFLEENATPQVVAIDASELQVGEVRRGPHPCPGVPARSVRWNVCWDVRERRERGAR